MSKKRIVPIELAGWIGLGLSLIGATTYFLQSTPIMARYDSRLPGLYISVAGLGFSLLHFLIERRARAFLRKSKGLLFPLFSTLLLAAYTAATFLVFRQEEVRFSSGEIILAGTLLIPAGEGPHPAAVFMHGAGSATRMGMYAEAQDLARKGIMTLIYDKRGSGATVGGHSRFDGYAALASDGVAAYRFLEKRPDVDGQQIGIWGTSEGGWTAAMAAAEIGDPAFLIVVSGGPLTPEEQGMYELERFLSAESFSNDEIARALALETQTNRYIRTGVGHDLLLEELARAEAEAWFEAASFSGTVSPPDALSEYETWWRGHMDIDIAPLLGPMDFPILFVLGASDRLIPAELVAGRVENILGSEGQRNFTIKIFPAATHNIMIAPANCKFCLADNDLGPFLPIFAPGYLEFVSEWVLKYVQSQN